MGSCFSSDESANGKSNRKQSKSRSRSRKGSHGTSSSKHGLDGDSGSSLESEARGQVLLRTLSQEEIDVLFFNPKTASWLRWGSPDPEFSETEGESEAEGTATAAKPAVKAVELLPEKEELRLMSWYRFLAECPQAVVAIRAKWLSITGQELDARVSAYCNHKQLNEEQQLDRWRRYIMQQLLIERNVTGTCLSDIDDAYLRVVATSFPSEEAGSLSHTGHSADLSLPKGTPRSDHSHAGGSGSQEIDMPLSHLQPVANLPHLAELYGLTITGDLFEPLMKEFNLNHECHLMYLFSKLLVVEEDSIMSPLTSPKANTGLPNNKGKNAGAALVRLTDQWSISLQSWRLGWLLQGCGGSLEMQHRIEQMKKEFDSIKLQDPAFSNLYLFLWSFANSENLPPTAQPTPMHSNRNTPENRQLLLAPGAVPSATNSPNNSFAFGGTVPLLPTAGSSMVGSSASPTRKVIPKDDAISIWTTVVAEKWSFTHQWCKYCEDPQERIGAKTYISLDQWKQLLEFMPLFTSMKHFEEHDSAMSSWPGVLDDFSDWMVRQQQEA